MIPVKGWRASATLGAAFVAVVVLVAIALGLVAVVGANLGTSADMRKESEEAYLLGEMQIAVTSVEESLTTWLGDPGVNAHPAADPAVARARAGFSEAADRLKALIDEDELAVVEGFEDAFEAYLGALEGLQPGFGPQDLSGVARLDLALRSPLLDLLQEESEHLLESVVADQRSERYLRWGLPLLLLLAILVLVFVIRLQNRSRQLDEARRLNAERSDFVASISHELRTPLTPVVAFSHELRDRIDDFTTEEIVEFATTIANEGDEVASIVEDLLAAAQLEVGHMSVRSEPIDVTKEVMRTLEGFGLADKVRVDVAGSVFADPSRFRQIMRNIVTNALRYGGAEVQISAETREDGTLIVVSDSGDGIPRELAEHAFKPYTTAHDANGLPASVGLGLAVSRNLARLMGGDLTYSYEEGWSRLQLVLPTADEMAASGSG